MIFVLNAQERVEAVLSNESPQACPFFEDTVTERLENGMSLFEFSVPALHQDAQKIKVDSYVATQNLDGDLLMFRVREVEDERGSDGQRTRRVLAENIALELLDTVIRPKTLTGVTAEQALTEALVETTWRVGTVEWAGIADFEWEDYPTALAAVHDIAENYPADVVFRADIKGGRVVGRFVDFLEHRGAREGKRFEYGQDVQGIKRTEDRSELATAIIGAGQADEDGNIRDFAGISDTFVNEEGTTINKPVGQDYIGDPDALQRWGKNGTHIFGALKTEEVTAQGILAAAWEELKRRRKPKLTYEMDVALLERLADTEFTHERVRIGDEVLVVDHTFEPALIVEARVVEMQWSLSDPSQDEVTLANFREITVSESAILAGLRDLIRRERERWVQIGEGEFIYKDNTPPSSPNVDDLWLDTSTVPNILKRWNGSTWVNASPTEAAHVGSLTGAEIEQKAAEAAEVAEMRELRRQVLFESQRYTAEYSKTHGDALLPNGATKNNLATAKSQYDSHVTTFTNYITSAIADGVITTAERNQINTHANTYQTRVSALEEALGDARALIAQTAKSQARAEAVSDAQQFTTTWAQKNIFRGTTPPSSPSEGDFWLDESTKPATFNKRQSGQWVQVTRPDAFNLAQGAHKTVPTASMSPSDTAYSTINGGVRIAVDKPVNISHVTFDTNAATTLTLGLYTSGGGTLLQTADISVGSSGVHRMAVNFSIEEAGTYDIKIVSRTGGSLRRTTSTATNFPYNAGTWRITTGITAAHALSNFWYGVYRFEVAGDGVTGVYDSWIASDNATFDYAYITYLEADVIQAGTMLLDRLEGGELRLGGSFYGNGELRVYTGDEDAVAEITEAGAGFQSIQAGTVNATNVPTYSDESYTIFVNSSSGDDMNSGETTGTALRSLAEAVRRLPRIVDGDITIQFPTNQDFYEDVDLRGIGGGGTVRIRSTSSVATPTGRIRGSIRIRSCTARIILEQLTVITQPQESTAGIRISSSSYVRAQHVVVQVNNNATYGFRIEEGGFLEVTFVGSNNSRVENAVVGVEAFNGAQAKIVTTGTAATQFGSGLDRIVQGWSGLVLAGSVVRAGANTGSNVVANGEVRGTFTASAASSPPTQSTSATTQWTSNTGSGSWRGGSWRSGTDVYQGDWGGWGLHHGIWTFGAGVNSTLSGRTIQQMRVRITRRSTGGVSGDVGLVIRPHNHASRPAGQPSYNGGFAVTVNFKWGETKWVTLPNTWHALFRDGAARGIGIYTTLSTNSNYAICTGTTAILEATYT